MNNIDKFIESGILEMYVLGQATAEETVEVEKMAASYIEVRTEIDSISRALELYAMENAKEPDPMIFPFLMATIDYMERLQHGEPPTFPPVLNIGSRITDYAQWLDREDMHPLETVTDMHARIIGYTPEVTTAVVWLKDGAPPEIHTDEQERFLVVEGSCEITIGNDVHTMTPGDVLIIPLHISHHVKVTSRCLCKIILQRAAA